MSNDQGEPVGPFDKAVGHVPDINACQRHAAS
jgi:hypothetical protein